jgi:hypothetical protein
MDANGDKDRDGGRYVSGELLRTDGITVRQWFAGQALSGLAGIFGTPRQNCEEQS